MSDKKFIAVELKDKLNEELVELRIKFNRLTAFLEDKEKTKNLTEIQLHLLQKQYDIMQKYIDVLVERMANIAMISEVKVNNEKEKKCKTQWSNDDITLPYVFDLLFDIKTEAQLYFALKGIDTGHVRSEDEIYETALQYGYTKQYLNKYKK